MLTASIQDMLGNRQHISPAVGLVMHFPALAVHFDRLQIMLGLMVDGQLAMAQRWAADLGLEAQVCKPSGWLVCLLLSV